MYKCYRTSILFILCARDKLNNMHLTPPSLSACPNIEAIGIKK